MIGFSFLCVKRERKRKCTSVKSELNSGPLAAGWRVVGRTAGVALGRADTERPLGFVCVNATHRGSGVS